METYRETLLTLIRQQQSWSRQQEQFYLLASSITEFAYDPENGLTFDAWFVRYQRLFSIDAKDLDDAAKVRLLLRKLSTPIHERYVNYILPKEYKDFDFATTVQKLTYMFGDKISLFRQRYNCVNTTKSSRHDFWSYAVLVNKRCEEFKLSTITADQFKCLIFVRGLCSPTDIDIKTELLTLIDTKSDTITLNDLAIECQRLVNLKEDAALIQNQQPNVDTSVVVHSKNKLRRRCKKQQYQSKQAENDLSDKKPSTPCWFCGNLHYSKYCTYKTHKCQKCKTVGHRDGYCASSKKAKPKTR